jgi:hypothetical protein
LAVKVLGLAGTGSILQHESKLAINLESAVKKEAEDFKKLLGLEKTSKLQETTAKLKQMQAQLVNKDNVDLMGAYHSFTGDWQKKSPNSGNCKDDFMAKEPAIAYESRVLEGIWATAPYLHNGSVPTLADLLKPVLERPATFRVGPAYDPVNLGLAIEQTKFDFTLKTTDCSDQHSGNSRCGHEYGTQLTPSEKKSLLEYLKTL